jgi:hypothetical protein
VSELYEEQIIEFEAAMVDAQERWFKARDHIDRNILNERIFEGGFRMAWNTRAQPKQPSDEEIIKAFYRHCDGNSHVSERFIAECDVIEFARDLLRSTR